jgi:type IV secretion system protein VirB10
MAMADKAQPENSFEEAEPIVSVNSRGGESSGFAAKVAFAVLVTAILLIGILYSINRYRAATAAEQAKAALAQKTDSPNPDKAGQRVFSSDPPALPAGAPPTKAPQALTADPRCSDGMASTVLTGADQQPMRTPDGDEIRICRNGQVLILGQKYDGTASTAQYGGAPGAAAAYAPSPAVKPASRYGGDVVLPAAKSHMRPAATPSPTGTPPLLPTADTMADASSPPNAAQQVSPTVRQATPASAGNATLVQASKLADRDLILPQERSIDCALSVRLVSEVSGRAVCVLSSYVYGDTGRVVLAEPGTIVSGEYGAVTAQGQRRLYIVWTRMKTPRGVIIDLASPAADAMGTAGLPGVVDNRWGARIGAAFLLSMVQDAISYQTARDANTGGGNTGGGVTVLPQSSRTGEQMAEKVLDSTINIKPTIYMQPGDRATIMVARDLDFGSVYELRTR